MLSHPGVPEACFVDVPGEIPGDGIAGQFTSYTHQTEFTRTNMIKPNPASASSTYGDTVISGTTAPRRYSMLHSWNSRRNVVFQMAFSTPHLRDTWLARLSSRDPFTDSGHDGHLGFVEQPALPTCLINIT